MGTREQQLASTVSAAGALQGEGSQGSFRYSFSCGCRVPGGPYERGISHSAGLLISLLSKSPTMARLRLEGREQAGDVAVFVLLCLVWLWAEVWAPVRGLERNLNSSCLDDIDKPIHDSIVSTGAAIGVAAVVLVTAFASVIASSRTLRVYNGGWRLLCFGTHAVPSLPL